MPRATRTRGRPAAGAAALLALATGAGCALTAPMPGGAPRGGSFLQFQPTWAAAYGPATTQVHDRAGRPLTLKGNAEDLLGRTDAALFFAEVPIAVGLRQSLGDHFELGTDVGWMSSGLELRTTGVDPDAPWALSVSGRTGQLAVTPISRSTYQLRGRFELYPRLAPRAGGGATHLMLSAGVSYGRFAHDMALPDDVAGGDAPSLPPHLALVRMETRLELMVGVEVRGRNGSMMIALQPWFVLDAGAPVSLDAGWVVDSFSQSVGASLLFSLPVGGHLLPRDPGLDDDQ